MRRPTIAGLWLLGAGFGCTPLDVGPSPEMVWWTDNEAGDTSEWTRDGGGYTWTDQGGSLEVVTSPTRSGHYALAARVTSPGTGMYSAALATRQGDLPLEAYYSAWYYVPEAAASTDYWLFFKFRSRTTASDAASAVDVWDLDFVPASDGGMGVALYHHSTGNLPNLAHPPVPIGRWFQTEAFLRSSNDATGQLRVWFDGTLVFEVSGQPVMPSSYVEWSVGGVAEVISPAPATLYVDDAAISTERLGPGYPVFWRQ